MEMFNSGANPAVSHSQITRRSLGPIETCNSDPIVVIVNAKKTQMRTGTLRD